MMILYLTEPQHTELDTATHSRLRFLFYLIDTVLAHLYRGCLETNDGRLPLNRCVIRCHARYAM